MADDAGGGGERVIVVARDVTRVIKLQESVRRDERMSAMGSLVAGVAHEVRNPLFGISSTLDAFEARFGESEPFQKYVTVLRREADRLGELMRDLLDYGRPAGPRRQRGGPRAARGRGGPAAACRGRLRGGPHRAHGPGRPRAARPRADAAGLPEPDPERRPALARGRGGGGRVGESADGGAREAWCAVRDDGPGFRSEDLPRLFEPFFTRRRGGTGLGLSIAQRIVSQHGGLMVAANRPQGGAELRVRLPAVPPA